MPYIEIIEKDETTPGPVAEQTDVVYIPGLVDITQNCLKNKDGEYVGIKPNTPTLFTSVRQFESLCGTRPATFAEDQYYNDLDEVLTDGSIVGFDIDAIPFHRRMFSKGDADPSYIIAKECLSSGLSVLYERINGDTKMEVVTTKPANWLETYATYYKDVTELKLLKSLAIASAPLWYRQATQVEMQDETVAKYIISPVIDPETKMTTHFTFEDYNADEHTGENSKTVYIHEAGVEYYKGTFSTIIPLSEYTADSALFIENYFHSNGKYNYLNIDGTVKSFTPSEETFESEIQNLIGLGISEIIYELEQPKYDPITTYEGKMLHVTEVEQIHGIDWLSDFGDCFMMDVTKVPCAKNDFGTTTVYKDNDGLNIKSIYNSLEGIYNTGDIAGLADKGNYSIKYLTSGGYPVYEYKRNTITQKMLALAEHRGDCVAFIDHTDYADRERNINRPGSVYYSVKNDETFAANGEFGTMFTPWAEYNRDTVDKEDDGTIIKSKVISMPASFAYFMALADSIKTNANWLAIAGSARGVVPNLASDGMVTVIPNGAADDMQPRDGIAINAITNIKPYGWTIWGNRTLKKNTENLTATSFLNIRNLISDVKKTTYRVARKLTFEQNNDILWVNFKGLISPTLDRMLTGYGISGYKIVRDTQHEKASEKATMCARIILYPTYAVEDFYITVVLKDDEVSVE